MSIYTRGNIQNEKSFTLQSFTFNHLTGQPSFFSQPPDSHVQALIVPMEDHTLDNEPVNLRDPTHFIEPYANRPANNLVQILCYSPSPALCMTKMLCKITLINKFDRDHSACGRAGILLLWVVD